MGCPGLLFHRNCVETRRELGLYRWQTLKPGQEDKKSDPDKPVKLYDHLMDAGRYLFMSYLREFKPVQARPMAPDVQDLFKAFEIQKNRRGVKDWRFQ